MADPIILSNEVPANVTFNPVGKGSDGSIFFTAAATANTAAGYDSLRTQLYPPSNNKAATRAIITVNVPVEVLNADGVYEIAYTNAVHIKFSVDERAVATDKARLLAYAQSLLATQTVADMVNSGVAPW